MSTRNNSPEKKRILDAGTLDDECYFESLLSQAVERGALGEGDVERLQLECVELLAQTVKRFTAGESSSIRVEQAQSLMASNLFTIGLWLKTLPHPDEAVRALLHEPVAALYEKGRRHLSTVLAATRTTHKRLLGRLLDTPNVFYRSTLADGIHGFFGLYDADFAAQEIHITADYPPFLPVKRLAGVEFIRAYLGHLYYENLFCTHFAAQDVHRLLCGFLPEYEEHLINLYEPVLLAALGCRLAGQDPMRLNLTEAGAARLYHLLPALPPEGLAPLLQSAMEELCSLLGCSEGLTRYLQRCLPPLTTQIQIAVRLQTLHRVFVLPAQ